MSKGGLNVSHMDINVSQTSLVQCLFIVQMGKYLCFRDCIVFLKLQVKCLMIAIREFKIPTNHNYRFPFSGFTLGVSWSMTWYLKNWVYFRRIFLCP
jgi:hypothetical protein